MLGWWVIISTQSPEELNNSTKKTFRDSILAQWEVGPFGLTWIEDLVKADKAVKLSDGGYPNRYTANAGDVLPLIEDEGIKPPQNDTILLGEDYIKPMQSCPAKLQALTG
jgi:hypothetical protein